MQEEATNPVPTPEGHKNVNLTTFRKSGEPVVTSGSSVSTARYA